MSYQYMHGDKTNLRYFMGMFRRDTSHFKSSAILIDFQGYMSRTILPEGPKEKVPGARNKQEINRGTLCS